MPAKQPKKGKGKKVTVVPDPTSAQPPAPAAAPNPEVQAVLDAHIANVGSEHFPGGYGPIPYTLTPPDAESFPQLPPPPPTPGGRPLRQVVCVIDATRVNFALTRGVLCRLCCAVMGRYPTTFAVELNPSQVTLAGLIKTLKLCSAAASKEFVNVLVLQEMPPQGLDPEEQWLWVDPVKKSGWKHPTATDTVVRYQTVKVQPCGAVARTEFSTNRRLRTHIPYITHPTLYTTNAPFTMLDGWIVGGTLGARQVRTWWRQLRSWRAPTCDLAGQLVNLREPRPGKPTLGLFYHVGVFSAREGHDTRGLSG